MNIVNYKIRYMDDIIRIEFEVFRIGDPMKQSAQNAVLYLLGIQGMQ